MGITFNLFWIKSIVFILLPTKNLSTHYIIILKKLKKILKKIRIAINFTSNRETKYTMSLVGDEDIKTKLGISKNIHGFDLGFNANQTFNKKLNQEAELMLTYYF